MASVALATVTVLAAAVTDIAVLRQPLQWLPEHCTQCIVRIQSACIVGSAANAAVWIVHIILLFHVVVTSFLGTNIRLLNLRFYHETAYLLYTFYIVQ